MRPTVRGHTISDTPTPKPAEDNALVPRDETQPEPVPLKLTRGFEIPFVVRAFSVALLIFATFGWIYTATDGTPAMISDRNVRFFASGSPSGSSRLK